MILYITLQYEVNEITHQLLAFYINELYVNNFEICSRWESNTSHAHALLKIKKTNGFKNFIKHFQNIKKTNNLNY